MNRILTGLFLIVTLLVGLCSAEPGKGKLSPGDKVEIEWAGKRVVAEVVEYLANGWIKVKFKSGTIEMTPVFPPSDIRVLGGGAGNAAKRPLRTWTDATGKFKQKARFVKLDGDELTLETEAGKPITMSLEKLSEDDQAMARKIAAKAGPKPAGDGDENPFAATSGSASAPNPRPDMESAGDSGATDATPAGDWSRCQTITPGSPGAWSVPVDAGAVPAKLGSKPIDIAAANGQPWGFFEVVDGLLLARNAGRACVVIQNALPGRSPESRLNVLDLVSGKSLETVRWPSSLKPVGIDRNGEFILARADFGFKQGHVAPELGVWKLSGQALELVRVWNAKDPSSNHSVAPSWAAFVDADHVACVTFPKMLTVWNVPEGRAIWSMEIAIFGSPAISPGGKYLAAAVADGVVVLNALTGDTVGRLSDVGGPSGTLSFRPDGAQLAALSSQRLVVWDLVKGEIYRDIAFATDIPWTSVDWLFGGHLLAGGGTLVDLERRLQLWRYSGGAVRDANACGELGGWFWHVLADPASNQRSLHATVIPHDDALRMAANIDPEQALAIRPGASFSLDIRVQGQPAEQQKVQQDLTNRLVAAGMTVGNNAPLVLQATTETGQTREISYRSFGQFDRAPEKGSVTEQISRVKILENGRTLWESFVTSGAPMHLQMKEGQTVQEALAEYQKPSLGFFSQVSLPVYLARPPEHGAYGFSQLTSQGVVNTPPPVPAAGQAK